MSENEANEIENSANERASTVRNERVKNVKASNNICFNGFFEAVEAHLHFLYGRRQEYNKN